jgi:putative hydrolase of the HAD superfamily
MVGNNLARDIRGANSLGIISVWLNWSPRYPIIPADHAEQPRFTIKTPLELLDVLDDLEKQL